MNTTKFQVERDRASLAQLHKLYFTEKYIEEGVWRKIYILLIGTCCVEKNSKGGRSLFEIESFIIDHIEYISYTIYYSCMYVSGLGSSTVLVLGTCT